ncbi:MAG: alpha/beta hydrolase [Bacteroidetes bacterium]|nr:alpha/beta hydrolase [Bacteroidota bacterium]MCB0842310.1 alpha/beta hydrolase [Bacteroidota bacterium]
MTKKSHLKSLLWKILLPAFLIFNLVTFSHAWKFTHFTEQGTRTQKPDELTLGQKLKVLFTGVSVPKPQNTSPSYPYQEIQIPTQKNQQMNSWLLQADSARGVVLLFHGYAGHKSSLSPEALAFRDMGYHAVLIDFPGHGDSPGNTTSVGYGEAQDVVMATQYIKEKYPDLPVYLYGFSMGAVAVVKALSEENIDVEGAIICAPFHTLLRTVKNRFSIMGVPSFPFAEGLVFWGGIQHGFWAFNHQVDEYAKEVNVPCLVMHGGKDERASLDGVKKIYQNLKGPKDIHIFSDLAHQSYYLAEPEMWKETVKNFLHSHQLSQ